VCLFDFVPEVLRCKQSEIFARGREVSPIVILAEQMDLQNPEKSFMVVFLPFG
jgi:hypothetical protein